MNTNSTLNKTRIFEFAAVGVTVIGKYIFMDLLDWRLAFILTATVFWVGYLIFQSKRNPESIKRWGFRTDNFRKVLQMILPFGIICLISFIGIGLYQNTINLTWHIIPILLLYPIWGVIQQFLLIALTAGNLQDLNHPKLSKGIIITIVAFLFGLIHYPIVWLMIGCFIIALVYGLIYLKQRNVYVLGIFHGWLGGLFFYTVVDKDPFIDVFGPVMASLH